MNAARQWALSIGMGAVAGALYVVLGVASPAPPWPALLGLAGMVLGERVGSTVLRRVRRMRRPVAEPQG